MNAQQLLTIAAIMIFTLFALSANSSQLNQSSTTYFNEAILVAADLGQSLIEEIHSKAFDENTILGAVDTAVNLTAPNLLSHDSDEGLNNYEGYAKTHGYDASTTFDDVDDYNGFSRDYTDKLLDNFTTSVKVYYVNPSNPSTISNLSTFAKKVEVTISNPYLTVEEGEIMGNLKISTVITY